MLHRHTRPAQFAAAGLYPLGWLRCRLKYCRRMIEFDIDGQDIKAEAEAAEEPLLSPAEPIGIAEVLEDDIGGVRAVRVLEMRRPATRPAGCGGAAIFRAEFVLLLLCTGPSRHPVGIQHYKVGWHAICHTCWGHVLPSVRPLPPLPLTLFTFRCRERST